MPVRYFYVRRACCAFLKLHSLVFLSVTAFPDSNSGMGTMAITVAAISVTTNLSCRRAITVGMRTRITDIEVTRRDLIAITGHAAFTARIASIGTGVIKQIKVD